MKLSKKLKTKIKKNIFTTFVSVAIVTTTLAVFKLADFSMPEKIEEKVTTISNIYANSTDIAGTTSVSIADDGAIVCESIVQGVRDCNLPDGNYTFRVIGDIDGVAETKDYAVEFINYYDDVRYSLDDEETTKTISLGDDSTEYKMLVVKYHKNLTIDEGVTVTATNVADLTYKKGMYLCVMGELINKGEITMTARGTYNQEGENVYLWKKIDGNYEYVPAIGGIGGTSVRATKNQILNGIKGEDGQSRQTGGGGSGASSSGDGSPISYSGTGATGTSYSGGSGGGGCNNNSYGVTMYGGNAEPNGGAGGAGRGYRGSSSWYTRRSGGGAGNLGANGAQNGLGNDANGKGENGTGGLLVLYVENLVNNGTISSNGSKGGAYAEAAGGSSGAGSVNVFANVISENGEICANGESNSNGGIGGNGSVTVNELSKTTLNYLKNDIKLGENESYQIEKNDFKYIYESENFIEGIKVGNLKYEILDSTKAVVNNTGVITSKAPGETILRVTDIDNNYSVDINVLVAIKMESIVQGIRDRNLPDGDYTIIVEEQVYRIELINQYENVEYKLENDETEKTVSFGDDTTEYKTLVVKYHKDLIVDKGVTITSTTVDNLTYKKGMYICVLGELKNNGNISMTARGTYNCEGEDVYLWKNVDSSYEFVPKEGAIGGEKITYSWSSKSSTYMQNGNEGLSGTERRTGGGGSGALMANREDYSSGVRMTGAGTAGTSYSGGTGGGGIDTNYGGTMVAEDGQPNGGAGGNGYSYRGSSSWVARAGGGGAGNLGGEGRYTYSGATSGTLYTPYSGENGTGGLLIIYADQLFNNGDISSNGSQGGKGNSGGGSSGGGSINIFANMILSEENISANGGVSVSRGGVGGNGSVTINDVCPDLIYEDYKEIEIEKDNIYQINLQNLKYYNQNDIQTGILTVGKLEFSSMNDNIAVVDNNGKITAISEGKTKIKITDITNQISTYIWVIVKNGTSVDVQEGNNFTISLKQNGTVFAYGSNDNGQLGIGNYENKSTPTKIDGLENIKQISTGNAHAVVLSNNGIVYAFGKNENGQLGDGTNDNSCEPIKIEGINNIIKVDSYKDFSIALDNNGKVYVWGEGYSNIPIKIIFNEKVIDISGDLVLTDKGDIYSINDLTSPLNNLSNISKISRGTTNYLALTAFGTLYCVENDVVTAIDNKVFDISAGNEKTIIKYEDGRICFLEDNITINEINIEGLTEVEVISAGEGSHYGIVDSEGFVWHMGSNTYGESALQDNETIENFTKTGETIITTNFEKKYLEIGETVSIYAKLENTYNLKVDLIDDNQSNFEVTLSDYNNLQLNDKNVTGLNYCSAIATIKHNSGVTKNVNIAVAMKMDSIVQGLRDTELDDGEYTIVINDKEYNIELINYYGNVTYSENIELGDDSTDYKTLVVKYHGDLTIDKDVVVTAKTVEDLTYKKGMYLCVLGNIYNKGTITMTARGTYNAEGEDVYLWKNINDTYEYVPATGGIGATGVVAKYYCKLIPGNKGEDGINRQTGGGGSGSAYSGDEAPYSQSGSGAAGTAYSGGSGGGGCNSNSNGIKVYAGDAKPNGGAGGDGRGYREKSYWYTRRAGGGAGNLAGNGAQNGLGNDANGKGENGTGGLLILYADTLYNSGEISSEGSNGGSYGEAAGGSSGGGSVNIFARIVAENGIQTAVGGKDKGYLQGGAGGTGSVTVNELGSVLNYAKKSISIAETENYTIENSKLSYIKLNDIQTEDLNIGTLTYESLNQEIATVDNTGKITGVAVGKTKIKITDTANEYSTYIIVTVTKEGLVTPQIKEATNFTISLKANGTVWSYGLNKNGQLGNNSLDNSNEAVQVQLPDGSKLSNIVDIGADTSSAIAVDNKGNVYTWGLNSYKQIEEITDDEGNVITTKENIVEENQIVATKVGDLSNIVKVNCYNNNFYAISDNGNLFAWGKDYENITQINEGLSVADISKDLVLGENGLVYKLEDLSKSIDYLNNIVEISAGKDHYLCLALSGNVYAFGGNSKGQVGNGLMIDAEVPYLVKTEEGYLTDVNSISAGNLCSIVTTFDGKAYSFGDNTNNKLGLDENSLYVKQITKVQDKNNNEITLEKFEIAEAGINKSSLMDEKGFVYSVGVNKYGELGTEDNIDRDIFTRIGHADIITNPERITVVKGSTASFVIATYNSFNLKSDIAEDTVSNINNTNEKIAEIEKVINVDNSQVTNIDNMTPNYVALGMNEGRSSVVVKDANDNVKNIWVNVVANSNAISSTKLEVGDGYSVSLRANGEIYSFGLNTYGQLGLGDKINRNSPEKIDMGEKLVEDISVGTAHTLVLTLDGKVYSFGLNKNGQLGTGNTTTYTNPIEIPILSNIRKVIAKENTSFAIDKDGKVYAWGYGYSKVPTLLDIEANVVDIGRTYYLADDGIVRKIANNNEILLSYNENAIGEPSVIVEEKIVQMSEGKDHILLLGESGIVYGLGQNVYGQLGDGTTIGRTSYVTTAVRINETEKLTNIVKVSAGTGYSIALNKEGKVYFFGKNEAGELGENPNVSTGGLQESSYAFESPVLNDIVNISAGVVHTAVSNSLGEEYTFGNGENGELGNSENSDYYEPQLVGKNIIETNTNEIVMEVSETRNIQSIINYFNLYKDVTANLSMKELDSSRILLDNISGDIMALQSGRTTVIVKEDSTDKIGVIQIRILEEGTVPSTNEVEIEPQVATGGNHTITLKVDGTVWSYGQNSFGQLGDGTTLSSDEPVKVIFPEETIITKIASGEDHNLALDKDGNVWVWGRNQYYQLGNSKDSYITKPAKLTSITGIKDIEAGTYTSYAVTNEGEVYSFGLNANGECGIGSYTNRVTITKVRYLANVIDIKAGKNHVIALRSNGEVYVTGSNLYGELGNNDSSIRKRNLFAKVDGIKDIVAIGAGSSNNMVLDTNGKVYVWGSNIYGELGIGYAGTSLFVPTEANNVSKIRYLEGGKNTSSLIDSTGNVYVAGLNKLGSLGNNTNADISDFTKLSTISNVVHISQGNSYTTYVKEDGTVWGSGDYNHGDSNLKSKTAGIVPIQVGNDETGFEENEILVKVNGTKDISEGVAYLFNLIVLDDNFKDSLTYESLNTNIATVDEKGIVTGIRTGTTWIKATSIDGKEYIVKVNVVEEKYVVSPKVEAGENFAVVLKGDGTVYTYGYNGNGELAEGTNITKDVPQRTNIIATYKDISAGESFFVVLREDNTVWTSGKNNYGQLGIGSTKSENKLSQVNGITDVKKIAAGKNHVVILDTYGIMYGWGANSEGQLGDKNIGENTLSPVVVGTINERIIDISAGDNQTIAVTASGKVYGMGNILNGYLPDINNSVKVEVGNGYLLILTKDNKVYEYDGESVNEVINVSGAIDISVSNNINMYQSIDEKVYTWGDNTYGGLGDNQTINRVIPALINKHGMNTYTIGAGYNNSYVIENTGFVYASGYNEYGSIGNSTRVDCLEHALVGDRKFKIIPETKIMTVNDKEKPTIETDTFNVFDSNTKDASEYDWDSDNVDVIYAVNGELTAYDEGTAKITVTDKITGEAVVIERYVQPIEMQRIQSISVNNINAEASGYNGNDTSVMTYKVKVETDDNTGILVVKTKEETDLISLSETNWDTNVGKGTLAVNVDLPTKTTEIPIYIKIENGTIIKYILTVEKISKDVGIKKITVTSGADLTNPDEVVEARAVSLTRYEAVVSNDTVVTLGTVITNSDYAYVSIDGKSYTLNSQNKNIVLGTAVTKEVGIVIKSESGIEQEYTLVIYKNSELVNLEKVTVNDKEATKISEGKYSITVSSDVKLGNIYAKSVSNLVEVSIENNTYKVLENTNTISINNSPQEVSIKLKLPSGDIKEYILEIYKKVEETDEEKSLLDMVIVNGNVIIPNSEGKYEAYLASSEMDAIVKAIAVDSTSLVQIETNIAELGESEVKVETLQNVNTYKIQVTNEEGKVQEYTLIIKKAEADTSMKEIYVENGAFRKIATKKDETTYEVRISSAYEEIDVTAITMYVNSKVKIESGEYKDNKVTENIVLATDSDTTKVKITIQSENGEYETEYTLNIIKMSDDTSLKSIKIGELEATYNETTGEYTIQLNEALNNVAVEAITNSLYAKVKINSNVYEINTTTRDVKIDAKTTIATITVQAEDGTTKAYKLNIEGLPDNTNIMKVFVNEIEAIYKEGENKYIVRLDANEYNIEVVPEDMLAKVKLGLEEETVGIAKTSVDKTGSETIVKVVVISQNGLEKAEYEIVIMEKADNADLDTIEVNGKKINPDVSGNYVANLKHDTKEIEVKATAEDEYAKTIINNKTNNVRVMSIVENVVDGKNEYDYEIIVEAENGDKKLYELKVYIQEGNTNLLDVQVSEDDSIFTSATLLDDGTYYYKINRVDEAYVKLNLESSLSKAKINGIDGLGSTKVKLTDEITGVILTVIAEDGTEKEYILNIEKMSNDTKLKEITGEKISSVEMKDDSDIIYVYVDEDETSVDVTIETENKNAKLKLNDETTYTKNIITRTIDLSGYTEEGIEVLVDVEAENGETKTYTIVVYKLANLNVKQVKVNTTEVKYDEEKERYYKLVNVASTADVDVEAENSKQTVSILNETGDTVLVTGTGSVTKQLTLTEKETKFIIRITSHTGMGIQEYSLVIEQKSQETGISYIKVDGLGTILDTTGLIYTTDVSGKEKYPVEIKLKDSKAKVKLEDSEGNLIADYVEAKLETNVNIKDGETNTYKVTVMSENGETKEYTLIITRISSNTNIDEITVEDLVETTSTDEITGDPVTTYVKQPKQVTKYDEKTKTYSVVVNKELTLTNVVVTANSSLSSIALDTVEASFGTANIDKTLSGLGITKVTIKIVAADGTIDTKYLNIIQLSDEIGLEQVTVDGKEVTPDEIKNYEITVTDEVDVSTIYAKAKSSTSKVSINSGLEQLLENTASINKGKARKIEVPIRVTAEDGNSYVYLLTINIISHNTDTSYVKVDDENANFEDNEYKAFIDANGVLAKVEIEAGVIYSRVRVKLPQGVTTNGTVIKSETLADGTIEDTIENIQNLTFEFDTSDLTCLDYYIPYTIIAEDETEKEYMIHLARKSTENEIEELYVDGELIEPEDDGIYYAKVKDGNLKALLKVIANNKYAKVEFENGVGTNSLEKKVTIDQGNKTTTIPIKITSQQGDVNNKTLVLERISADTALKYIKVEENEAEVVAEEENTYVAYIYDTLTEATVDIGANNEYAYVEQVTVDEEGNITIVRDSINKLVFDITTPEQKTTIYFRIVAENGENTSPVYTLNIEKMSTDTSLKEIWVNGKLVEKNEEGKYVAKVLDTEGNPIIKAVTNHSLAHVRIALGEECLAVAQRQVALSTEKQTVVPITVRSQSGITKVTYLYIEVISTSVEIDVVTVDDKEPNVYDEKTHTYEFVVAPEQEEYELFMMTTSRYANISYEGADYGSSLRESIKMEKELEGKELKVQVTSENGKIQEYTILLIRESDDTSLEYLKVDGIEQTAEEDGRTYKVMIGKLQKQATIEVKTTFKYASIRIADEVTVRNGQTATIQCDLTQDKIIVPIIVTAPDGQTVKTYNVILIRGSNDTSIELKVNDTVINEGEDGNYKANILDTDITATIEGTILATSIMGGEAGKLDINATGIYETPTKVVSLEEADITGKRTIVVPIVVIAEDGTTRENVLVITVLSTDDTMSSLEVKESVDDTTITRVPTLNTVSNMYETKIKALTTNVEVEIESTSEEAVISYVDSYGNAITDSSGTPITAKGNLTVNVQTPTETTVVYYKITSESGTESTIYTLRIDKMSNNTMLQKVEVNEEEATKDIDGNYSIILKGSTETGNVVVTKDSSIQKVRINGEETTEKEVDLDDIVTEVTIEVEAEDGSKKLSTLTIIKSTTISGKITTENFEGKHKSNISIYNKDDLENPVVTGITEEDGSFELDLYITGITTKEDIDGNGIVDILENEYTVIVTKPGYLSYTVTKVTLIEGLNSDIGEYALIAGDTVETDEIEIDDLVALNDKYGVIITDANRADMEMYDLDEDGVVSISDRNILKTNYGKQAETVEWVNLYTIMTLSLSPELEEDVENKAFILPIACDYTITDGYGYRIHPITGEESKHTGVDLAGTWHTEILAVQSGEVVFAGVQTAFGNYIEIKHEVNGEIIYSFYAHLSEIRVEVGDIVEQGEVIGLEGGDPVYDENPGLSTGHHLHFEIRNASGYGNDINPYDYVKFKIN